MRKYKRTLIYISKGNLEPIEKSEGAISLEEVIKLKGIAKNSLQNEIKYYKEGLFIKYSNRAGTYKNYIEVI